MVPKTLVDLPTDVESCMIGQCFLHTTENLATQQEPQLTRTLDYNSVAVVDGNRYDFDKFVEYQYGSFEVRDVWKCVAVVVVLALHGILIS